MSTVLSDAVSAAAAALSLERVRQHALAHGLSYSGSVPPLEAWALVQSGGAVLVDVRTAEERKFVGQVPDSVHVAWAAGTKLQLNPRFVRELESKVGKQQSVLLLCSGDMGFASINAPQSLRPYLGGLEVLKA